MLKSFGQAKIGLLLIAVLFIALAIFSLSRKPESDEQKNSFTGVSKTNTPLISEATGSGSIDSEKLANNYFVFTKEAYETAKSYKQPIFLFFYANWCPTCAVQEPIVVDTFDSVGKNSIIGFRVNYNDSDTSGDEKELANDFGVRYQHTMFVLDQEGNQTEKFLGQTEKSALLSAFGKVNTVR